MSWPHLRAPVHLFERQSIPPSCRSVRRRNSPRLCIRQLQLHPRWTWLAITQLTKPPMMCRHLLCWPNSLKIPLPRQLEPHPTQQLARQVARCRRTFIQVLLQFRTCRSFRKSKVRRSLASEAEPQRTVRPFRTRRKDVLAVPTPLRAQPPPAAQTAPPIGWVMYCLFSNQPTLVRNGTH